MPDYDPATTGCTAVGCGTQDTATVDGVWGRRCARHPPYYSLGHLRAQLAARDAHAADAYFKAWLNRHAGDAPEAAA